MIIEYARPKTIEDALQLLNRTDPYTVPIGGGSLVSQQYNKEFAVVDLQDLGLNYIKKIENKYHIGATTTLAELEKPLEKFDLEETIRIQAGRNQRNTATIAGVIKKSDGRSPLLTALLPLDSFLVWEPGNLTISLGNWLPVRGNWHEPKLIKEIIIPDIKIVFDSVARSPKDKPIICCAIAKWPNGRMRAAVGGFGEIPLLVSDGNEKDDLQVAVRSVLKDSNDQWASSTYRMETGMVLMKRLYSRLSAQ